MTQHLEYVFSRADFVALSTAVARRPIGFRLAWALAMWAMLAAVLWTLPSGTTAGNALIDDVLAGNRDWWPLFALVALFSLVALFRHRLAGLNAAAGFGRMALADKTMVIDMDDETVHVVAGEFDWSFPWAAVRRLIETDAHLVLATGGAEGLPLPRRALATPEAFAALRDFVLAHLPKEAARERA